jgi:hypothetical protein
LIKFLGESIVQHYHLSSLEMSSGEVLYLSGASNHCQENLQRWSLRLPRVILYRFAKKFYQCLFVGCVCKKPFPIRNRSTFYETEPFNKSKVITLHYKCTLILKKTYWWNVHVCQKS